MIDVTLQGTSLIRHFPGGGGVGGVRFAGRVILGVADGTGQLMPVTIPVAGLDALIDMLRELKAHPELDIVAAVTDGLEPEAQP